MDIGKIIKNLIYVYIYIYKVFQKILLFLWNFIYVITILKSLSIHYACQYIIGISPRELSVIYILIFSWKYTQRNINIF